MTHRLSLTQPQRKAAELLATKDQHGKTNTQIAEACNISIRTLSRWRLNEHFISYQTEIAERLMHSFLSEAYIELRKLMKSGQSEKTRLKAIELILKNQGRLKNVQESSVITQNERSNEAVKAEIARLEEYLSTL